MDVEVFFMKKNILIVVIIAIVIGIIYIIPKNQKELQTFKVEHELVEVTIKGEVQRPGTYQVKKGMTLSYLIYLSGGFTEYADIDQLIFNEKIQEKEYVIQKLQLDVEEFIKKYDLNQITYEDLIRIPNITESRALEIILYRRSHQKFIRVEELLEVKGIGQATFDKIKVYFYV